MLFGFLHPAHSTPSHRWDSACPDHHATDRTRCGQGLGHRRTSTPTVEVVDEPRPTQQWSRQLSALRAPHRRRTVERRTNHISVGLEACRTVVARQIHCHDGMAIALQVRSQQLPAPRAVPRTVHQRERRHVQTFAQLGHENKGRWGRPSPVVLGAWAHTG
jgi:hypothetical protein